MKGEWLQRKNDRQRCGENQWIRRDGQKKQLKNQRSLDETIQFDLGGGGPV